MNRARDLGEYPAESEPDPEEEKPGPREAKPDLAEAEPTPPQQSAARLMAPDQQPAARPLAALPA